MKLEEIQAAEARLLITHTTGTPFCLLVAKVFTSIDENGTKVPRSAQRHRRERAGINAPAIVKRRSPRQSCTLIHAQIIYITRDRRGWRCGLRERTGLDRVFFANTGTEAWEAALKLARAYAGLMRRKARRSARNFWRSIRASMAAPSAPCRQHSKKSTACRSLPWFPAFEFVRFNDIADLRAKFSSEVCAILVEAFRARAACAR